FVCQAEDCIRDRNVTGVQTCALPISSFKVKEINLTYSFDRSIAQRLSAQNIHITAFAKNPMFWAKNSMNEDPETAFRDGLTGFGVPEFTLPPIRSMGVKLAIDF